MIGGFVSGVAEDGGDCQYIVDGANLEPVTVHTYGLENNGSTSCGSTTIPPSQVPPGTYDVTLRYVSATGKGEAISQSVEVEIQ